MPPSIVTVTFFSFFLINSSFPINFSVGSTGGALHSFF